MRPEDLDEWGVFTLIRPDDPKLSMAFVANKIKITGVSGQLEDLFIDFIGAYFDQMPHDDWENDEIGTGLIIGRDGTHKINGTSDEAKTKCMKHCVKKGEIQGAYAGIRKTDENKYKCICLDRTMKDFVGMIQDPPFNPRDTLKTHPEGVNPFFFYKT